jgi:hypothetical protein
MSGTRSLGRLGWNIGLVPAFAYRSMATVVFGLLVAAATIMIWRQMAGALRHPLQPASLLAAALAATAAATVVRGGKHRWPHARRLHRSDWLEMIVTSLAVTELTIGLCLPGTSVICMATVGTLVATEESWAWIRHLRRHASRGAGWQPAQRHRQVDNVTASVRQVINLPHGAVPSEAIVQQLTRSRATDGAEEIVGWLRTRFEAGQRTGNVHVAFCPPLGATPELSVEQIEGPEARIKTAQVFPYGARLDLKLAATAEEATSVLLQFSVRTAPETTPSS